MKPKVKITPQIKKMVEAAYDLGYFDGYEKALSENRPRHQQPPDKVAAGKTERPRRKARKCRHIQNL